MTDLIWSTDVLRALDNEGDAWEDEKGAPLSRELRNALGHFTTGVTVITYESEGEYHGLTVNSFTSVSMEPPLILVSLRRTSKALLYLLERNFVVNVLGAGQRDTALEFAGQPQPDVQVEWIPSDQAPRLAGSLAHFVCTPWASYDGGDHQLLLGRVLSHARVDQEKPLIFFRGSWRGISEGDHS